MNPSRAQSLLSVALLVLIHLSCLLAFWVPFSWGAVGLAAGGYVLHMWAITAGYHRYFSHRSYKTSRAMQFVLALLGTSAMQNGPLWWASHHRRHHRWSDQPGDIHSPVQNSFWYSQIGWVLSGRYERADLSNVKDLSRFPELRFLERHKWLPIIGYAAVCFAILGLPGLVWGFSISTIAVLHATGFINSLAHVWGSRRYDTGDASRNNAFLAVLTMGEGWHNNHHHCMTAVRQGVRWWEIDVTWYSLKVLSWLGIVWDLRARRAESATPTADYGTARRSSQAVVSQPLSTSGSASSVTGPGATATSSRSSASL